MKKSKLFVIMGAMVAILTVASPASAEGFLPDFLNPGKMMQEAIVDFFNEVASDIATAAFELLSDYVIGITEIDKIPSIKTFMQWSQAAGGVIAGIFFIKRLGEALRDELTGETTPNIAEIIGSFAVSCALIFATPYIILNYIIPINNQVVKAISKLGIDVKIYDDVIDMMTTGDQGLHFVFLFLIWAFVFIAFSISGAIRYVDLAVLLIMGPLVATSYVNRSQVYATYWTEVVAVVFTQSIHMLLAYFVIQWASDGTFLGFCFSLAGAVVALRGPQVLRQFLYTSGSGGMLQGAGRMASYKFLMKGVGK